MSREASIVLPPVTWRKVNLIGSETSREIAYLLPQESSSAYMEVRRFYSGEMLVSSAVSPRIDRQNTSTDATWGSARELATHMTKSALHGMYTALKEGRWTNGGIEWEGRILAKYWGGYRWYWRIAKRCPISVRSLTPHELLSLALEQFSPFLRKPNSRIAMGL